jgi:hypothetical protein
MSLLRWTLLTCLVLGLAGCGIGKKDKGNGPRSGAGDSFNAESHPTYPWIRPTEDLRPQLPSKQPGERDPF